MELNIPILESLANSKRILIAGAGSGQDVLIALPLYYTLQEHGKEVFLANYSFVALQLAEMLAPHSEILIPKELLGVTGELLRDTQYFPEGYLAKWFKEVQGTPTTIWMFQKLGVAPMMRLYQTLVDHLQIDALILVDGGVDSLMRGDEVGSGTLLEDAISLAAIAPLNIPVKLLACLGFGTEVEEEVSHYSALENIAALAKAGVFLGSCALTPQMKAFQFYEAACRYVWESPKNHAKSHISTRIIPAVQGEFGDVHLYTEDRDIKVLVSPLMSLYWFFDANGVIARNLYLDRIRDTQRFGDVLGVYEAMFGSARLRPRRNLPY
jgi:hypothetical protein